VPEGGGGNGIIVFPAGEHKLDPTLTMILVLVFLVLFFPFFLLPLLLLLLSFFFCSFFLIFACYNLSSFSFSPPFSFLAMVVGGSKQVRRGIESNWTGKKKLKGA